MLLFCFIHATPECLSACSSPILSFFSFSSFPLVEDESPHIAPAGLKLIMIEGGEITPLKVMVSKAS